MNLNIILNIFKAENIHISELVAVGGGAKSKSWQKIFADVYNTKIILPKLLDEAVEELTAITGQAPVVTKAKKSIANFKLREGMPIGCKVTLRQERCMNS